VPRFAIAFTDAKQSSRNKFYHEGHEEHEGEKSENKTLIPSFVLFVVIYGLSLLRKVEWFSFVVCEGL